MSDYSSNYLTFVAKEAGTFTLTIGSGVPTTVISSISYSLDGSTWTTTSNVNNEAVAITTPTVQIGDKVYWKGPCSAMADNYTNNHNSVFTATGLFDVEGNITSLLYGDDFVQHQYEQPSSAFTYLKLFYNNKKVVSAANLILPSKTSQTRMYQQMFYGCTNLVSAPNILVEGGTSGYYMMFEMFRDCSQLSSVYDLHLESFGSNGVCQQMFYGCTSLVTAPALPALTLYNGCYQGMFSGCTNLTSIKMYATNISATNCLSNWVNNVNKAGIFYKNPNATWANTYGASGIPTNFRVHIPIYTTGRQRRQAIIDNYLPNYVTFVARESGTFTFTYMAAVTPTVHSSISYSLNGKNWVTANNVQGQEVTLTTPTIPVGGKVYWKGTGYKTTQTRNTAYCYFSSTGQFDAEGNTMSLLYGDQAFDNITTLQSNGDTGTFNRLFYNCTTLVNAKDLLLPCKSLPQRAYCDMFEKCSSLVSAPALPATSIAAGSSQYSAMFQGCSSLVSAPALPLTTLSQAIYQSMFQSCTSLVNAPALPATTLASQCYSMMFYGCSKLETAPDLPAKTLASSCYTYLFSGCTKLTYIKALFTEWLSGATNNWVTNVKSSGTFVKASDATWTESYGNSAIPTNFTVETEQSEN